MIPRSWTHANTRSACAPCHYGFLTQARVSHKSEGHGSLFTLSGGQREWPCTAMNLLCASVCVFVAIVLGRIRHISFA
jgi:hypothetical protein